ncbi:hypothetical protein [Ochrobactrum sp. Marseille-Q0166]|uniref:hypothetical protein n=1 Tax=Ochrobactrum sp. Marseille-Q0166 TaxID=2761105 RepID=UPI001655B4B1|nr:hypothetical protein [Ochrobactrum sp. Marseille-Q0166]MBC8716278.1 hypothetical protein [Ochrobactrum sp. Marseille-Q0166]
MNVSEATSAHSVNIPTPVENKKPKIIFVPSPSGVSSTYKTPKLQDLRSAFLLEQFSRVEKMRKVEIKNAELNHTNDWHTEAKEGQYPWSVSAASVFVNEIQPPTQDRVLTNRDLNPNNVSSSKSKKLYNKVFNEFKKDVVHYLMNLTYHHASKLDDNDVIKEALLLKEEKISNEHESLKFNYAYIDKDGQKSKNPCGMFLVNLNKPEDKWILKFGGEISKINIRPDSIYTKDEDITSSLLFENVSNLSYGKDKFIESGDLKNLILKKYEDNIESKRNSYRGEDAFDNSKLTAIFRGLKKGILSSLCCANFCSSLQTDDLDSIHESARQLGGEIGKAAPAVVVATVAGLATGGAGAALVGGTATALISAGVKNAGNLNSAYNSLTAKKG